MKLFIKINNSMKIVLQLMIQNVHQFKNKKKFYRNNVVKVRLYKKIKINKYIHVIKM